MKYDLILTQDSSGNLWLKSGGRARRVLTVSQAGRKLRRSRRQLYRHISEGTLETGGKILGEWVLDAESVERLADNPLSAQPVPHLLQTLFPEHEVSRLNAGRDKVLILGRVLANGGLSNLRWLLKRYGRAAVRRFLEEDASRLLDSRALRLWSLCFRAQPKSPPSWRRTADPWRDARL